MPKTDVEVLRGHKSPGKTVAIEGNALGDANQYISSAKKRLEDAISS